MLSKDDHNHEAQFCHQPRNILADDMAWLKDKFRIPDSGVLNPFRTTVEAALPVTTGREDRNIKKERRQ